MKGIACFDMDMTLLNHADFKIPESASRALEKLRDRYYIVISTGRDMDSKFSEGLAERVNPDAIIHLNGTKITVGGTMIYEHLMKKELVSRLLHFTEGEDFSVGITNGTEDYFMNPEFVTIHDMRRWGQSERNYQDPWKLLAMPVRTMTYIGKEPGTKLLGNAFPELKFPMFSSREGADIIELEASKAEGLKRLCEYYGVPVSGTVAFGDSMNDIEIIRLAGIGVAMGNGIDEIKQAADYVTTAIGDNGVWNACEKLHLF